MEMETMNLTKKQQTFCDEYLVDLNKTQAAIRAGYSAKTAYSAGERLLRNVEIQQAVQARMQERSERTEITQDIVITTIFNTVKRCEGKGLAFDPGNVLKGCEILGRHLGMFKKDNEQGKDRLVIIKDFTGGEG